MERATPESVGLSTQRLRRVRQWLDKQISSERLAGASVLVSRRGKVAFFETAGQADLDTGKCFEKDTIVRIYSMSKPVTTVAAMMLYERGAFQLDDPLALHLPEFSDTPVWLGGQAGLDETEPQRSPMTIRQLMSHTSGLTYGFMHANVVDARYREQGIEFPSSANSLKEWVERLATIPLMYQPGSEWNYSVATDVLGRLVEVWSGLNLEEFLQLNIFDPLQMADTGFQVAKANQPRFSALYSPPSGAALSGVASGQSSEQSQRQGGLKLQESSTKSHYFSKETLFSGGGGLTSSMADYARFCQMLLNRGEWGGQQLLSPTTVAFMRMNQLPDNKDMAAMGQPVWSETNYDGIGFGLGFAVVLDPVKAHTITSKGEHHWGGAASTFFWLDPEQDLFVVFFTQLMPSSTYRIRRELRTAVYQSIID
ncbi:MAG: CubicO group peptidase (beta-lactamase class C family) [Paraglaciecola psychrophila]|jgi:CubicO group peptidase (beta-lactamase class C family)